MNFRRFAMLGLAVLGLLGQAGCVDPAEAICDRAEECGGLKNRTRDQCLADFKADLAKGQLEDCANCVEDHSCSEIKSACENACDF